jgi:methylated-DNA-[protein]-cysteine S-methyltransferase
MYETRVQPDSTIHTILSSPIGDLTLVARAAALVGLYFRSHWYRPDVRSFGDTCVEAFTAVQQELEEYFAGERRHFDVPLHAEGDSRQRRVWQLIQEVPYSATSTYGELARELSDGTTAQEVGAAVGRNPLSILVPCHRIVGSTGKLTGYAGGLRRKQFLLDLERDTVSSQGRLFR